jgi:hypothetical protein
MNRSIPISQIDTTQYLTVGRLMEKLQFEDMNNRIAINVENPEGTVPSLVTLLLMHSDGNFRDLFVWVPKP